MAIDFGKVSEAKAQGSGNFIKPCDIIARIDKIKQGESRKGDAFVAIEMTVYHVFEGSHSVGENVTHMLMQKHDSFLGNWKGAIMGITGGDDSEVTEEASNAIVSDEQPLSNLIIRLGARNIQTKAGNDFTVVDYHGEVSEEDWSSLLTDEDRVRLSLN